MSTIDPEDAATTDPTGTVPDAAASTERLGYSGMTNAQQNDGTAATDTLLPGDAPTGKETARVEDVVADEDTPLITRLQPGTE